MVTNFNEITRECSISIEIESPSWKKSASQAFTRNQAVKFRSFLYITISASTVRVPAGVVCSRPLFHKGIFFFLSKVVAGIEKNVFEC